MCSTNAYRDENLNVPSWKRALDGICILVSLPFTLPVFAFVALWVKLVSPGPVLFRQERVGFKGKHFTIFKFRTMRPDSTTGSHEQHTSGLIEANTPMTKLDALGDPRIILGGRILRALGLDELPQLLNVVRGEMSLVGPRPCLPCEWERLRPAQRERYNAAPGLTGYWQVNGKNKTTFSQMVEMDIFYTRNLSLAFDLEIMLRTFPAILSQLSRGKGKVAVPGPVGVTKEVAPVVEGDL